MFLKSAVRFHFKDESNQSSVLDTGRLHHQYFTGFQALVRKQKLKKKNKTKTTTTLHKDNISSQFKHKQQRKPHLSGDMLGDEFL